GLLEHALADLADGADLAAIGVVDGVLVVDLDELGLLVDDEDGLGEHRPSGRAGGAGGAGLLDVTHDLLGRPVDGRWWRRRQVRVDAGAAVGGDVLRPAGAVPVAVLVAAGRVGVPACFLRHGPAG